MNKILFIAGILCFLIPFGLQIVDEEGQKHVIETYEKEMELCKPEDLDECIKSAIEYNCKLYELQNGFLGANSQIQDWEMNYNTQLSLSSTGAMGNLEIPKIDLKLPIYHGTDEEVLVNGIGHLEGSSLPIGGKNSHSVLTGHRGLPSAELFTRLDELEEDDVFFLYNGNRTMVYKVTQIQVVEPKNVSSLQIEANKDQVSLVTCTPYGINTHRLIVTGERIADDEEESVIAETEEQIEDRVTRLTWVLVALFIVAVIVIVRKRCK